MVNNGNGKFKIDTIKDIADIRGEIRELKNNYREIKENHLVHIQTSIDSLDEKIDNIAVNNSRWNGMFTALSSIALAVLIYFLTKKP